MKYFQVITALYFLIISASCGQQSSSNTVEPANQNGYPAPSIQAGYPVNPGESNIENKPGYLQPGFITPTPDPALVSVIVSNVEHEGQLEKITLKNISNQRQDIGAFMLFSPELSDRFVLPVDLVLDPEETFTIYNGAADQLPQEQVWLEQPILTQPGDEVWLVSRSGAIEYYYIYYPPVNR